MTHNMITTEMREFINKVKDLDININEGKNKMNDRLKVNMKPFKRDHVTPIDDLGNIKKVGGHFDSGRTPSISNETKQAYLQYMKAKVNRLNNILNGLHNLVAYIQDNMEHLKSNNQDDIYYIAQNMKTISDDMESINKSFNTIKQHINIPDDYDQDYYNDPNEFV